MATLRERVAERYPSLLFLLNVPEIRNLLTKAVDPGGGLSPGAFQSKLMATQWFRRQSESQRKWWALSATDPGEARQQRSSYGLAVNAAAFKYGAWLTPAQTRWLTEVGLQRGWEPGGIEMLNQFKGLMSKGKVKLSGGEVLTNARAIRAMAKRDYLVTVSQQWARVWGERMARGLVTMDNMRTAMADKAWKLYPQFQEGLKQGYSMADLTDEYRQIIAQELEIDPERIDLSTGRWSQVLAMREKGGKTRPMTKIETLRLARQDPRFWQTGNGKQIDNETTRGFLQLMGQRPSLGLGG